MKIAEEETGSNPYCLHPLWVIPRQAGSGVDPAVLQQRGLTVRRKTKKQKEIASTSIKRMSTQRLHLQVTNYKDHR